MDTSIEISNYGTELGIRTPGRYAMDIAVGILTFLESQSDIEVKNTGWKDGYGLDVAVWLPIIHGKNFTAEISTDGAEFNMRISAGSKNEFKALVDAIEEFLADFATRL